MSEYETSGRRRIASDADVQRAIDVIRSGGVIAVPTDTVYGIAASIEHPAAIERLFSVKGRSGTKAVPVLVSSPDELERLAALPASSNDAVHRLVAALWPGALTIVVEASALVPAAVLRDGTTVGIRMPDNADALAIISGAGGALAVTSANRSGDVEARSADEVRAKLGGRIDFVVDGGPSPGRQPSTVIDATRDAVQVLRHGAIPQWRINDVLHGDN